MSILEIICALLPFYIWSFLTDSSYNAVAKGANPSILRDLLFRLEVKEDLGWSGQTRREGNPKSQFALWMDNHKRVANHSSTITALRIFWIFFIFYFFRGCIVYFYFLIELVIFINFNFGVFFKFNLVTPYYRISILY